MVVSSGLLSNVVQERGMGAKQRTILLIFGALVVFCALLVVVGNFLGAHAGTTLTDIASEGLKMTISALVGALSALLGANK
jgi:hypothetical protein